MNKYLINAFIYAPLFLSCLGVYMAFHQENKALFPYTRDLTEFEVAMDRRGLLGDAAIGLLTHLLIFLSSETKVQVAAKIFYAC